MDLTMIKKFADVSLEAMLESGNYDITTARTPNTSNNNTNLPTYRTTFLVPTLHNMTLSSPLQTHRALPQMPPTSRRLALELTASFLIYDALFFFFHLSLHMLPFLRRMHAPHHRHGAMHPQITNQLHFVERLGLVLLANFSLNIIGSHVFTRTLFVPVFVWLLVELHSGLDLPWGYEKVLPRGWGGGARNHAVHHAGEGGGLEPYFTWWDGLVGRIGGAV
jgi:cholesterol 25-hydroxylase